MVVWRGWVEIGLVSWWDWRGTLFFGGGECGVEINILSD